MWNSGMLLLHRRRARLQTVLFSYFCLFSFALSPKYTHCFHVPLVWPGACLTLEVFRDLKLIALHCGALCDVKIRARMAEKLTAKYQYCPGERDKERGAACAVWQQRGRAGPGTACRLNLPHLSCCWFCFRGFDFSSYFPKHRSSTMLLENKASEHHLKIIVQMNKPGFQSCFP